MTSKCAPVTTYQKLHSLDNAENGIVNEVIDEIGEEYTNSQTFTTHTEENEEHKNDSGRESPVEEQPLPSQRVRKRSVLKRGGEFRSKNATQKRVSFSSVSSERKRRVSNATDCFSIMRMGTEFTKVRPMGRQYQRFYHLDDSMDMLHWQPSSKKPEKAMLPIVQLFEVRLGRNTAIFKEQAAMYLEECCFSLIVAPDYESIDLIAKSSDEANIWVTGLRLLITQKTGFRCTAPEDNRESLEEGDMREKWLRKHFREIDKGNEGVIGEGDVSVLLKKLWMNAPPQVVKQKFLEAVQNSTCNVPNKIDEDDFSRLFIDLTTRQEVYFLLVKYSSNGLYLTVADLMIFLETEQKITWASKEYSVDIINRCEPSEEGRKKQILGIDGFAKYFFEKDCHIFDPEHGSVCEDMKKPLSHYFIASAHHTYVMDDEIKGISSIEGYISALQDGCRCVELVCWDGADDEPMVFHGNSMHRIVLHDVLDAINEYAFVMSDYPLILSLENHCSMKQQDMLVDYLKTIFGDYLYHEPCNDGAINPPSLDSLKGKVIVKNKKLPRHQSNSSTDIASIKEDEESSFTLKTLQAKSEGTDNVGYQKQHNTPQRKVSRSMSSGDTNLASNMLNISNELSELVGLCKGVHFDGFQHSLGRHRVWDICSIGETTARNLCKICPEEFVSYNKKFLSRIYPGAQRVDSSNFNPVEFWNCGSQLVALNYQYPGLAMDLNRGRFSKNGHCGYTLKPAVMREEVSYFSPTMKNEVPGVSPLTLQIKIISAYQLPKPRGSESKGDSLDPYVMVELYGLAADCHYERSRTVPHNGFNPVFDETFEFRVLLPELALLRFVVLDDEHIGDCFIGQYTLPLDCVREGYRTVYLLNNLGESQSPSSLFVHISFIRESEMTLKMKGFSLSKSLKKKENINLKTLNMKVIDDTFKLSIQPLREAMSLRDSFQTALNNFKECCGLTPQSNIKQCIRVLSNRVQTLNSKIVINVSEEVPSLDYDGEPTPILTKIIDTFETFLKESRILLHNAGEIYEKLNHARRSALEWHSDLQRKCLQEGFNERRTHKVMDNFSWNIKALSGQANLLNTSKQHCEDYMKQIKDVARTCNLAPPDDTR